MLQCVSDHCHNYYFHNYRINFYVNYDHCVLYYLLGSLQILGMNTGAIKVMSYFHHSTVYKEESFTPFCILFV